MSGGSFTDPQIIDFAAATGSVEIDTGTLTEYYFKLTNIPKHRRYIPTMTAGTGTPSGTWGQWVAFTTFFAPNFGDSVGSYSPYEPGQKFYPGGVPVIIRVRMASAGTFTWAWTSEDGVTLPDSWYDPQLLVLPSGSIPYSGTGGFATNRYFILQPTTADPITITTNEPNGYYEVYRETGVTTFDDWIEDGQNNASGTPTDVLQFTPIPGETYYVPLYASDNGNTYTLTWAADSVPPPPYVVTNDDWHTPTPVTLNAVSGSFDYDNTGASTELDPSEYTTAKRSIYYELQRLETTQWLRLTANPSISDTSAVPELWLWHEDASDPTGWNYVPFLDTDGTTATLKALAGMKYLVQLHWPTSGPASPWDPDGTVTWSLRPVETYENPDTPAALPPGAAGQNTTVTPLFAGGTSSLGERYYTITAPMDGSLQVVLEAAEQNSLDHANAFVSLGDVGFNVPERLTGATTPAAQGLSVKTGETVKVFVQSGAGPVILRWGMSTTVSTWHEWHSAGWSDVGTPSGSANPGIRSWPHSDFYYSSYPPGFVGGVSVQATVGSRDESKAWIVGDDRMAGFAGRAIGGEGAGWGGASQPEAHLSGHMLADGAGDWQQVTASASTMPAYDYVVFDFVNWASETTEHTPNEKAIWKYYYDNRPIFAAGNKYGEWTPSSYTPYAVMQLKAFAIEWSEPNVERWNRYERITFSGVRTVTTSGLSGDHYTPEDALDVGLFATPNTNQNWQLSPGGMAGGQLKAQWGVPNVYGTSYSEDPGPLGRESQMTEADLFGGGSPTKGVTVYNDRYNLGISPFEGGVDYAAMRYGLSPDGQSFTFFNLGASASVQVEARRVFPNLYRLGIYAENLEPIATEPPVPPPPPGRILHPNLNLDGEGLSVEVLFQ